jgi:hypothetical protein
MIPVKQDLETLDYAYQGQPFCSVPAKSDINLDIMNYAYQAQPFCGNPFGELPILNNAIFFGIDF